MKTTFRSFIIKSSSTSVSSNTSLIIVLVFTLESFTDAANWIDCWIREKYHNPTEFT